MKDPITTPGKTYAVTSPNGCTVTQRVGEATIVHDVPAGVQVLIIAQAARMEVSDDSAIVTECGGSAELVFTAATTRAASSGTGSDGMTADERALLMGAAQRDADNTFSAGNTFTGAVDMSGASVTPPEGWNVGDLTPEAIKAVVPMAWGEYTKAPTVGGGISIGNGSESLQAGNAFGTKAKATGAYSTAVGLYSEAISPYSIALGCEAARAHRRCAITIGTKFGEIVNDSHVWHTCTTEGTGSITIGAGANTLNNGDTESSNSVTIGCKASNQGADSVVIGAQASGTATCSVVMGAGASNEGIYNVVIGDNAQGLNSGNETGCSVNIGTGSVSKGAYNTVLGCGAKAQRGTGTAIGWNALCGENCLYTVALGGYSECSATSCVAVGYAAKAKSEYSTAIGYGASVYDRGATVIRSTASDGTYTQLYFSGANTPLANTYHGGAPMLGYVTKDSAGNIVAAGTRSLIDLLTDNSTFAPASLDENGDWVMPKVFHPSDLDMPQEEPTEPEEYQPLPVYPIVEPEIEEMEEV